MGGAPRKTRRRHQEYGNADPFVPCVVAELGGREFNADHEQAETEPAENQQRADPMQRDRDGGITHRVIVVSMQVTGNLAARMNAARTQSWSLGRKKSAGPVPSRRYNHRSHRHPDRTPLPGPSHHPLRDPSPAAVHGRVNSMKPRFVPIAAAALSCALVLGLALPVRAQAVPAAPEAAPAPAATPAKPRPKIGLVLSGGGARGLTHIGVLKVLHEMKVPDRLHRGDVDGRDRGRPLRQRHDARRNAKGPGRRELADAALRQSAAPRCRLSPQGRAVAVSAGVRDGLPRR